MPALRPPSALLPLPLGGETASDTKEAQSMSRCKNCTRFLAGDEYHGFFHAASGYVKDRRCHNAEPGQEAE